MRITGGTLRGRDVAVEGGPGVRPTSSRVREALFSMVGQDLDGRSALDAFGGSGLLAFEAASRGASPITIGERDRRVAGAIRRAAERLSVQVELHSGDVSRLMGTGRTWDLVMLDPPYRDAPEPWLRRAAPCCDWLLAIEYRAGVSLPTEVDGLEQVRARRYGDTALALYRARPAAGLDEDEVVP